MIDRITYWLLKNALNPIYVGITPMIKAKTLSPKAKAGLPGNMFDKVVRVIGIVIWNKNAPNIANNGLLGKKASKGADITREPIAVLAKPNLSPSIPPNALPKTIPRVNRNNRVISDFQAAFKPYRALIDTENNNNNRTNSKYFIFGFIDTIS